MKLKVILINFFVFVILYIFTDIIFSKFIFKQSVDHKCYEHINNGKFYKLKKNCFANMKLLANIDSFKVYTDENGFRFSGKKNNKINKKNVIFLGDSQTFGVGSEWKDTFIGILEKKLSNYNLINLGVPSYSPTVYKYVLDNYLKHNSNKIEKVFLFLDITDVSDETNRWIEKNKVPELQEGKIIAKQRTSFSRFKKEYFKGAYLISGKLRNLSRKIRGKYQNKNISIYKPVEGNPTGGFVYTDNEILTGCNNEDKKTKHWKCKGVEKGVEKIEKNLIEISKIIKQDDIEFYIMIMPWPDTINFGQTHFNWETFAKELCGKSKCDKLINLFPDFNNIKAKNKNWLRFIYLKNDIHLTAKGHSLVANKILVEAFN